MMGFGRVRVNSWPGQRQNRSGWSVQGKDLSLLGQTDPFLTNTMGLLGDASGALFRHSLSYRGRYRRWCRLILDIHGQISVLEVVSLPEPKSEDSCFSREVFTCGIRKELKSWAMTRLLGYTEIPKCWDTQSDAHISN